MLEANADVQLDQSDVGAGLDLVVIGMDDESRDFSLDERPFLQTCDSKSLVVLKRIVPFEGNNLRVKRKLEIKTSFSSRTQT